MQGTVIRHDPFPSRHVAPRPVDVWLPPSYEEGQRYPVLYMHDGQNLFYEADAYIGETWGIDTAVSTLITTDAIPAPIVVGVWNAGDNRWREYMPQRPLATSHKQAALTQFRAEYGEPLADAYLRFLVTELKPFIDRTYATRAERNATFIMGSSLGALISLYALCEYPDTFAGAGCVSTHWPALGGICVPYVAKMLPPPGGHKVYFDYGDQTTDAAYQPFQQQVDRIMVAAGYEAGNNWVTRYFAGADHSEPAWRARVHLPLLFLLGSLHRYD